MHAEYYVITLYECKFARHFHNILYNHLHNKEYPLVNKALVCNYQIP